MQDQESIANPVFRLAVTFIRPVSCSVILRRVPCLRVAFLVVLAALFLFAHDAVAAPAAQQDFPRISVRVGIHDGFQRIVFDWPRKIAYGISQQGLELHLHFDQSAAIDLSPISSKPLPYVKFVEQKVGDDTTDVKLVLAEGIMGSAFQDNARIVVDLKSGAHETAAAPLENTGKEAVPAAPEAANVTVPSMVVPEEPAAAEAAMAPESPAPPPAAAPDLPAVPQVQDKKPETSTTEDMAAAEGNDVTVSKDVLQARKRSRYNPPPLDVGDAPLLLLALDPGSVTGAAIFRRGGFVYVVFDKKVSVPLDQLIKGFVPVKVEPVDAAGGSVYRFYLPQDVSLRVMRDQTVWSIYAARLAPTAPISLAVTPQPNYALGARLVVPLSKMGATVRFYDPEIGDLLLAVPLLQTGQAVRLATHYADFDFVSAEQGLVIQPRIDGVDIKRMTQGIEITAQGGLRLSPESDTGLTNSGYEGEEQSTRLYDFKAWYGPPKTGYTTLRQRMEGALAEVTPGERDRIRFDLARFNFARNHPQEAQAMLALLVRTVPDIELRSEFLALRGAVKVLTRDSIQAISDLSHPDIKENPEAQLWRAAAYARMQDWQKATDIFMQSDTMLGQYPEPHFTRFSLTAIEAGLSANNSVYAAKVLDRLVQRYPDMENKSAAVQFLRGTFLSLAGHLDRAEELWTRAAKSKDPLYRVRAVLALTDLDIVRGKIKPAEAAARLERLRYAWRGDDLELDFLRRLGKFYIEAGKVAEGLSTLKEVLAFLPDNDVAKKLRDEMAFAFRDVFLGDKSEQLSPLDALSLYERFYELAPLGDEGDAIIRSLAERMVAVDLLDRAAAILSDQVRRRLTSTFKSRIGAQAAGIYLLDGKAEAALKILADSEQPDLPPELVTERILLKARALADQGRKDPALDLIKDIQSDTADRLRADIAWKARDWIEAAVVLDRLIGTPPSDGQELPPKLAPIIINRSIALAMANDIPGLDAMRKNFGAFMKKTPQADLFRSLAEPESGLPRDEKAMRAVSADVELFQEYLENYRKIK